MEARVSSISGPAGRAWSHVIASLGTRFFDSGALRVLEIDRNASRGGGSLALAGRQHGVVTVRAARGGRVEPHGDPRTACAPGGSGALHHGVYLVGPLESPHARAMAAVLATGRRARLPLPSRRSLGLAPTARGPDRRHDRQRGRSRPGIIVHRATLDPEDITRRHGIPVTSAARTLLDLAATEPTAELDRALNEADLQRRVSTHSLNEQFSRYPHHRGTAALKEAARDRAARSPAPTPRSSCARPDPQGRPAAAGEPTSRIEGYEVDLLWRDQNLIVEIDSWAFHSMRRSFERDRRRDQRLVAPGWRVIRVTWRQLTQSRTPSWRRLATALAA